MGKRNWSLRMETLRLQINRDVRKLAKFRKTGEPAWLNDPEAMFVHRLNCAQRVSEYTWLRRELGL